MVDRSWDEHGLLSSLFSTGTNNYYLRNEINTLGHNYMRAAANAIVTGIRRLLLVLGWRL